MQMSWPKKKTMHICPTAATLKENKQFFSAAHPIPPTKFTPCNHDFVSQRSMENHHTVQRNHVSRPCSSMIHKPGTWKVCPLA